MRSGGAFLSQASIAPSRAACIIFDVSAVPQQDGDWSRPSTPDELGRAVARILLAKHNQITTQRLGVDVSIGWKAAMLRYDISRAQPLAEGIGKRRVTVENADFHSVSFRESAGGATLFLWLMLLVGITWRVER